MRTWLIEFRTPDPNGRWHDSLEFVEGDGITLHTVKRIAAETFIHFRITEKTSRHVYTCSQELGKMIVPEPEP